MDIYWFFRDKYSVRVHYPLVGKMRYWIFKFMVSTQYWLPLQRPILETSSFLPRLVSNEIKIKWNFNISSPGQTRQKWAKGKKLLWTFTVSEVLFFYLIKIQRWLNFHKQNLIFTFKHNIKLLKALSFLATTLQRTVLSLQMPPSFRFRGNLFKFPSVPPI